jgi:hypothetical protein
MTTTTNGVPQSLRTWFVIHFVLDVIFAIPLMAAPVWFLGLLGWQVVDPIAARLVAAALFGIGIESFLGRNAGPQTYRGMLNLKIIWSLGAIIGILVSMLQGAHGQPLAGWGLLAIFAVFNVLWVAWRLKLR